MSAGERDDSMSTGVRVSIADATGLAAEVGCAQQMTPQRIVSVGRKRYLPGTPTLEGERVGYSNGEQSREHPS